MTSSYKYIKGGKIRYLSNDRWMKEKGAAYCKARYARLRAEGKCTTCSKPNPTQYTRCDACREKYYDLKKRVKYG